jgi:glycosyltransferase involved in cell wall biosynthesis
VVTAAEPRILALAYSCEPGKGSEPEAGWVWARLLAQVGTVTVITRANNRYTIEPGLLGVPERDRLDFEYVDLPAWARRWKRGTRGMRLYYVLWQLAALRRARALQRARPFDLVWHLTLANAWIGSVGPLVGPPFAYGPVGGGIAFAWRLVRVVGARGAASEAARGAARLAGRYLNPFARLAWSRAEFVIAQNAETREWLPRRVRSRVVVFPNALVEPRPRLHAPGRTRVACFSGRLLAWKGGALALRALALAPGWRLVVFGSGPDEQRLRRLAEQLGVLERVDFRGFVDRGQVLRFLAEEADVFLLPSLHDDASFSVAEAVAAAVPVVCLAVGGPHVLAPENAVPLAGDADAVAGSLAARLNDPVRLETSSPRSLPLDEVRALVARAMRTRAPASRPSAGGGVRDAV